MKVLFIFLAVAVAAAISFPAESNNDNGNFRTVSILNQEDTANPTQTVIPTDDLVREKRDPYKGILVKDLFLFKSKNAVIEGLRFSLISEEV